MARWMDGLAPRRKDDSRTVIIQETSLNDVSSGNDVVSDARIGPPVRAVY